MSGRWQAPAVIGFLAAAAGLGCARDLPVHPRRTLDPLSARFADESVRLRARAGQRGQPLTATALYRVLLSPRLGSRCHMLPSESEYVDRRARTCGSANALLAGVARVMLEAAMSPALLTPTVVGERLRFVDEPPLAHGCGLLPF